MTPRIWPAGAGAPRLLLHALRFDPAARANAGEASALAAWLAARGTPVHVVAAARPGGRGPRLATTRLGWHVEEWEGMRISRCPLLWAPPHARLIARELEGASFALSSVPVLLQRAKSLAPDIVGCFETMPWLLAATLLAARRARARSWLHLNETAPLTRDRSLAALAARFDHVSLAAVGAEERLTEA